MRLEGERRLLSVDLAVRGRRGDRSGLKPANAGKGALRCRETFRAIRLFKTDAGQETRFVDLTEADLMDGDVDVRVEYSTVNYKDGLALTGNAPVVRVWPLTPGIDFAGVVERSTTPASSPATGWC